MLIVILIQSAFSFTQYLPIQNQYIEAQMVYDPLRADEFGFGYGAWMRHGPLMKIGQVGSILQNQSNDSLVTYIKDADTQQIQMVVQLSSDYENLIMKFQAYVFSNTQTHHIQHQIDPMKFEGLWYIFYFQCKPALQKCQFLFSDFNINQTILEINEEYPFKSQNLNIIVGGGLKQDSFLLTYFPGIMMYETFDQQYGWFEDINAEYFFSYGSQYDSCFGLQQVYDDIFFNRDSSLKFDQNSYNVNGYTIVAWYKLVQTQSVGNNVNIIRANQNGYQDFLNYIGGNAFGFQFSWDVMQSQAKFISYSYLFPTINLNIQSGDPFQINQIFDLKEDLQQWAYLQYSFSLRNYKILFQIQYPENSYEYVNENAHQFSRALTTLYIGNNYYDQSNQQGVVKGLNFDFCEGQEELNYQTKCDVTCGTCFGPYNYECLSCYPGSNRQYYQEANSCICFLGYLESGSWQCFGQDSSLVLVKTRTYDCEWGQFTYKNKCLQCPNFVNNSDINCLECLSNPKNWIYDPYCQTSFQQQHKGSNEVYIQTVETKKQYYFLQNEQLIAVSNIANLCQYDSSECSNHQIQHLDQATFVQCQQASIFYDNQCVDCYDPYCVVCTPIKFNIPCSECVSTHVFDMKSQLCEWWFHPCFGSTCPQYCGDYCTFCSHNTRNCKACMDGYYVGFDYKCHACSIKYCIKCFEFNMYDLNENTLNFRFKSIDSSLVNVGCVECGEGFIYDFVLQDCKPHKQQDPCLQSYINIYTVEVCTLEKGQQFSGISPQISYCTILITNCQICIKVLGKISCVKCLDTYFADSRLGTCTKCQVQNAIGCVQFSYQDQDQSMENYQGFFLTFRTDGLIYSSQVWFPNIAATKCVQGFVVHNNLCLKYCDSNCKTCIYDQLLLQYVCQDCYPQYGFQMQSLINGQCTKCPYLCQVCYPRTQEAIKNINNKFIYTDQNQYVTHACVKSYQNYPINSTFQIARYFEDQMEQGSLDIFENIYFYCDDNYFDFFIGAYRFEESQNLIDFLNIRQPNSYTHNISLLNSGFPCSFNSFRQETILRKRVFILLKQIFQITGSDDLYKFQQQNFTLSGYDQVRMERFTFQFQDQQTFELLDGEYVQIIINCQEFYVKNMTFSNDRYSRINTNIRVQNATLIVFELTRFEQYHVENAIFLHLVQENNLVINMNMVSFHNCNFTNFTFLKTNPNLQSLQIHIKSVTFINCSLINFQFINNNVLANNYIEFDTIVIQACTFTNTHLISQIINGNLKLINLHIYLSNLTNSSIISLNSNSMIDNLQIERCNLYNSMIISLNTFVSSQIQIDIQISNISIYNITYDSSRLIELDSYNFFKFNLILDNINFKYNQLINTDQNVFQGFWVIRCQDLQISNVYIIRKFLNNIEFMLVNVTNIKIYNLSVTSDGGNSSSNALIAVDQFQTIHLENVIVTNQVVVNQPIIFITSESQIQLFSIQQEIIQFRNMTFSSNILKKTIKGKFESMIYIISNHYQSINIQDIHFKNNLIIEQIQNNQIDSSGLLFVSSYYSNLALSNIKSYNDTIINTTNTLFYLQAQTIQLDFLESQMVNWKIWTQSSIGVMMLISNIVTLQNVYVNQVKSQVTGLMNIQTDQQGIININNMTIQGIQTLNNNPLSIDEGIIQIDNKISSLQLNITNIIIFSSVLGSGGFLRINSQKMENSINIQNITINNLYAFQCQLICMVLNNQIQYQNDLNIKNITIINDIGYEFDMFRDNQVNTYLNGIYNLMNINNSIIEASYTNISIVNLSVSGPLFVGYFLLTNMQNVILNQIKLVNSDIISSNPLYFTLNNDMSAKFLLNNIIISNITVNQQKNRRLLEEQSLYGYSFIQISKIQNQHQFQIQNLIIQQINYNTCLDGFFVINLVQGQNIHLNIENLIFNNNKCGLGNCLIISNSQMNETNILQFINSKLFENQANLGLMQITNLSLSFENVTFIKNKALTNGSTITFDSNQYFWNSVQIIENSGIQSGGLITKSTDFLNLKQSQIILLFNIAKQQPDNLLCLATNLILFFQNIQLQHINTQINDQTINTPDIIGQGYLYFPNIENNLSSYQIYDLQKEEYIYSNLKYDLYASNKFMEIFSQYQNSSCQLDILNKELNTTYSENIQLSNQPEGSTFDNIYFRSNPYSNQSMMVVTIQCDFIQNYKYILYAKSLPCQLGEYYFNQTCKTCDYIQGYYSVTFNATSCTKADTSLILNNTSNNLELQQYYWRPNRLSPYIEYCHQNKFNCIGGWKTGDQSCLKGHLGGLCESCDIYNIRGDGQFSQDYGVICVNCGSSAIQIITILGTLIWTLISAFVTVRSIIQSNLKLKQLKKMNRKFFQILFRQDQDQSSTLLKMAIYDMQIIQAIYTFQINFSFNMSSFNDFVSYPIESVTYNIQCNLSQISDIPIIYLRIIWILFISIFTFILFIMIYLFFILIKKQRYESVVIYTSLLYMFVYTQPYIMRQVSSLVASRTISNLKWIQGNVSYRYDTINHYKWIAGFAVPIIITFGVTIPLLFFILLFKYRQNLYFDVVRNKIGYLYNEYRQHSFYWENVKILHMQFIIFILTIYQDQIQLKACIIYLIFFFYFFLQQNQQPYNQSKLNKFDNQMIFVIGVCLILSQAIYSAQQANLLGFKQVLEIILNLLLFYIYINFLIRIVFAVFQRLDSQIDALKDLIKTKGAFLRRIAPGVMRYLTNRARQKARVLQRFQLIRNYLIGRVKGMKQYESILRSQQIDIVQPPLIEVNQIQLNTIFHEEQVLYQQLQILSLNRSVDAPIIEKQKPYQSVKQN